MWRVDGLERERRPPSKSAFRNSARVCSVASGVARHHIGFKPRTFTPESHHLPVSMAAPTSSPDSMSGGGTGLLHGVAELLEAVAAVDRTGSIGEQSSDLAHRASRIKEQLSAVVQLADSTPGVHHSSEARARELERTQAETQRLQ